MQKGGEFRVQSNEKKKEQEGKRGAAEEKEHFAGKRLVS
jgi:hypothetical protein